MYVSPKKYNAKYSRRAVCIVNIKKKGMEMKRLLWHIGIRIYIHVWLPIISFVMNRWWMWKKRKSLEYFRLVLKDIKSNAWQAQDYIMYGADYIADKFDWQSSPLVFILRDGGDCEDWSAFHQAIHPGGRIYRLYNIAMRRGHAVYVVDGIMYDQKTDVELPKTTDWTIEEKLLVYFDGRYTEVI